MLDPESLDDDESSLYFFHLFFHLPLLPDFECDLEPYLDLLFHFVFEGLFVDSDVGGSVGDLVGLDVGGSVGDLVGLDVGSSVGGGDGEGDGEAVGSGMNNLLGPPTYCVYVIYN